MALFKTKQARLDEQLFDAIHKNEVGAVAQLLQKGANANAVDVQNCSPLIIAVYNRLCTMEMIDVLLENGADVHYYAKKIGTPLTWAAIKNKVPELERFVSLGADIESRDDAGNRTLHHAACHGSSEVLQVLLKAGADTTAVNNKGQTPLDMAERHDKVHTTSLLKQHNALLAKQARLLDDARWIKTGESEIARISQKAALEYQVTEIFNFSAHKYTQIMHNLKTDAESQAIVFFDAYADKRLLAEARNELLQQNGTADEDSVRNVLIFKPAARN